MCLNPAHWISTHVVTCLLIALFVYMVLFKGTSFFNMGGFLKIAALVVLAATAYAYFVPGKGTRPEMADFLPGFTGTAAQGVASGMDARRTAYDRCLTQGVIASNLVPESRQYCSTQTTLDGWEHCMGATVLCGRGGDAGCLVKTQCDAQAEGSTPLNLLKGLARALLAPLIGLFRCA
jgi:hypothetical protein